MGEGDEHRQWLRNQLLGCAIMFDTFSADLEQSACCAKFGKMGFLPESWRRGTFSVCTFLLGVTLVLNGIAAAGYGIDTVETLPWRRGHAEGYHVNNTKGEKIHVTVDVYVGLTGTVTKTHLHDSKTGVKYSRSTQLKYDEDSCTANHCTKCEIAGHACFILVLAVMATSIPAMRSDWLRIYHATDTSFAKGVGFFTAMGAGIAILIAMSWFHNHCVFSLSHYEPVTKSEMAIDWTYGVGMKTLVATACTFALDALAHFAMPVDRHVRDDEEDVEAQGDDTAPLNPPQGDANKPPL